MTAFALAFGLIVTAFIAALFLAMPAIVERTLPLGVSVPQSRVDDPVVRSSVRLFRWLIVAGWVVCAALGVGLAMVRPDLALAISPILFVLIAAVVYVTVRQRIVIAKREGDWYGGAPVSRAAVAGTASAVVAADSTTAPARSRSRGHPQVGWLVSSLIVLSAVAAVGVAVYPSLPATIPTHWNGAGQVDQTAPKSIWSVFTLVLVPAGTVVLMYALSWLVVVAPVRSVPSDTPEQAEARAGVQRHLATTGLGMVSLALAVGLGITAIPTWLAPRSPAVILGTIAVALVLILGTVVVIIVRYAVGMSRVRSPRPAAVSTRPWPVGRPRQEPGGTSAVDAPDDDRYWKLGGIYVNRHDRAVFVQKRFGVGWTINFGSVGGMVFGAAIVLIVAVPLVISLVSSATH